MDLPSSTERSRSPGSSVTAGMILGSLPELLLYFGPILVAFVAAFFDWQNTRGPRGPPPGKAKFTNKGTKMLVAAAAIRAMQQAPGVGAKEPQRPPPPPKRLVAAAALAAANKRKNVRFQKNPVRGP